MKIHQNDSVGFALERGLGRAGTHAGRIFTVVAHNDKGRVFDRLAQELAGLAGERVVVMGFPDPFNFVTLVLKVRDIVNGVARLDQGFDIISGFEFPRINDQRPLFGRQSLLIGLDDRFEFFSVLCFLGERI